MPEAVIVATARSPIGRAKLGMTAENVAEKYDVSRERMDEFAKLSQDRAATAPWASRPCASAAARGWP